MFSCLDRLSPSKIKGNLVLRISGEFSLDERLRPLLERVASGGTQDAKRQANRALERL